MTDRRRQQLKKTIHAIEQLDERVNPAPVTPFNNGLAGVSPFRQFGNVGLVNTTGTTTPRASAPYSIGQLNARSGQQGLVANGTPNNVSNNVASATAASSRVFPTLPGAGNLGGFASNFGRIGFVGGGPTLLNNAGITGTGATGITTSTGTANGGIGFSNGTPTGANGVVSANLSSSTGLVGATNLGGSLTGFNRFAATSANRGPLTFGNNIGRSGGNLAGGLFSRSFNPVNQAVSAVTTPTGIATPVGTTTNTGVTPVTTTPNLPATTPTDSAVTAGLAKAGPVLTQLYQEFANTGGTASFSGGNAGSLRLVGNAVTVDLRVSGNASAAATNLAAAGLQVQSVDNLTQTIEGLIPINLIPTLANQAEVVSINPVFIPIRR